MKVTDYVIALPASRILFGALALTSCIDSQPLYRYCCVVAVCCAAEENRQGIQGLEVWWIDNFPLGDGTEDVVNEERLGTTDSDGCFQFEKWGGWSARGINHALRAEDLRFRIEIRDKDRILYSANSNLRDLKKNADTGKRILDLGIVTLKSATLAKDATEE